MQKIKIFIYICLSLWFLSPADAYILKGEHVLQLMIEKNNLPVRLYVDQRIVYFDPGSEAMNTEYEQRVRYRIPEQFRADIDALDLERIRIVSSDDSLTVIDGRIVSESETWVDHYKDLFFYRSRKRLVDKLESLGINFSVTGLGRYNGVVCYIVGAEYQDETVPQLWIAKDTFLPIRWIFEVSDIAGVVEKKEILYDDWKSHYNSRYPSKIEFYRGENLVQRISVLQVEINPPFAGDIFDIEQLKNFYSPGLREETEPTDQNEIEKRIEEFKKIYQ